MEQDSLLRAVAVMQAGNLQSLLKGEENVGLPSLAHTKQEESISQAVAVVRAGNLQSLLKGEENVGLPSLVEGEQEDSAGEEPLAHDVKLSYGTEEEQRLAQILYGHSAINYTELFYGTRELGKEGFQPEEDYWVQTASAEDTDTESLSTSEAEQTIKDIQYSSMIGARHEVSCMERRKFDLWIKFNPALFKLFETNNALTRDVNYASFS